jgi:glycosyltransferase involved in cell wall biosynthesis
MKNLLLTDGVMPFAIGGMQKHSQQLAKHMAVKGHEVTLVHCIYGNQPFPAQEELNTAFGEAAMCHLEIITLRFPRLGKLPGHYLNESYLFSKQIFEQLSNRLNSFDFIYSKGFAAWYFIERKKKGMHMPPISVKFHGYEMFQKPANLSMWLQNLMLKRPVMWNNRHADYIFSYGGGITTLLNKLGLPDNKIIDIPTGIDPSWCIQHAARPVGTTVRFCFVGRYERRKGIEELHDALKKLSAPSDYRFEFVGPIPATQRLKQAGITYHGSINNTEALIQILDECDILVAPSHSEGMPNVIMEAMARGLAIVTTRVGAIESVVDESNGWFVEPGNSESLMGTLLQILSSSTEIVDRKKEASRQRISSFSWDKIAERTIDKIRKLVG